MDESTFNDKFDDLINDYNEWLDDDEYIYKSKIKTLYVKSFTLKVFFNDISYRLMKKYLNEKGVYKRQVKLNDKNTDYYVFRKVKQNENPKIEFE